MSDKTKNKTAKGKDWGKVMKEAEEKPKVAAPEKHESLEHPEYNKLEGDLTAAEQKTNEYWNEVLRLRAEIENMHRRFDKDIERAHKYGLEKFASELLPVIDSLEHGLDSCSAATGDELYQNIKHGMELTHGIFLKALNKFNVEQVDPIGKMFNPELHEAMSMLPDPKVKPNTVIKVMQKGYLLNGRLIRPALVIVAKKS